MGEASIAELGEFGLIARVAALLAPAPDEVLGNGDDAAVVRAADGRVVISTDALVEGRHFRLDWSSGYDIGRKAAAQAMADISAMGGRPTAIVVALGAPKDFSVALAEEIAEGLGDECKVAGAGVVGGDMVSAPCLMITVTAIGSLDGLEAVTRSGAQPGDVVVLAGALGSSGAGRRLLSAGIREHPLVDAHRRPTPPYALGPALARAGATAMIDVSDGLAADAGHISLQSGVRIEIEGSRIALAESVTMDDVLHGGEDHALIACLPADALLPAGVLMIGQVTKGAGVLLDGTAVAGGWDHFKESS